MIIIQLFSCGSLEGRERRIEVQFEIEISMKMEKKKYDGDLKYVTWRIISSFIIENNLNIWIEWNTIWWNMYKQ